MISLAMKLKIMISLLLIALLILLLRSISSEQDTNGNLLIGNRDGTLQSLAALLNKQQEFFKNWTGINYNMLRHSLSQLL